MSNVLSTSEREPLAIRAAITAAVGAVLHVVVLSGAIPGDLEVPIVAAVDAVGLVALLLWARPTVTANARVVTQVTNEGLVTTGDAAVVDTGAQAPLTETQGGDPVPLVAVKPELVRQPIEVLRAA